MPRLAGDGFGVIQMKKGWSRPAGELPRPKIILAVFTAFDHKLQRWGRGAEFRGGNVVGLHRKKPV